MTYAGLDPVAMQPESSKMRDYSRGGSKTTTQPWTWKIFTVSLIYMLFNGKHLVCQHSATVNMVVNISSFHNYTEVHCACVGERQRVWLPKNVPRYVDVFLHLVQHLILISTKLSWFEATWHFYGENCCTQTESHLSSLCPGLTGRDKKHPANTFSI